MARYDDHGRSQAELKARIERLEARLTSFAEQSRAAELPDPVSWAERVSGMALDPWQREFMRSSARLELLNCCRQSGKTTVVSLRCAYRVRFFSRVVGVLSPTLDKSRILYRRAKRWLVLDGARFGRSTAIELEVLGGGTLLSFPGDRPDLAARGETLDDLVVDEASRVKDALIVSASPTQATRPNATETWLSTPAGRSGKFYQQWEDKNMPWRRTKVTADDCSRISRDFLELRRRIFGEMMFRQEFHCEFLATLGGIFDPEALGEVFGTVPPPQLGEDWLPHGNGKELDW